MLSNAYIAGFFDGEGCIVLTKNGQCKIYIVQKDDEVLQLIKLQFGGTIYKRKPTKIGGESFALQFSKKEEMINFLLAIHPYCFVKRNKVDIALRFLELTQSANKRKQGANGLFLPCGNLEERNQLRQAFYN